MHKPILLILFLLPSLGFAQDYSKSELVGEWTFDMVIIDALGKKDTVRDNYVPNFKFTKQEVFFSDENNEFIHVTDVWKIIETNEIVIYEPYTSTNQTDFNRLIEKYLAEKRIQKLDNGKYYWSDPITLHIKSVSATQLILDGNGGTIFFKRL